MNTYLIYKSLHLIAVISWMAGLLYLPRIFVYHAETDKNDVSDVFKVMERRLFLYIMNPAMILSWIFGLLLLHSIGLQSLKETWIIAKIILVSSLTLYHFFLFSCLKSSFPTVTIILLSFLELLMKFQRFY